ncbi:MAG: ATP synthase F1 subunit epsilon [Pseudomonadota bacterium]|nr:ATP synthase F1 subunit epsilon [Pseudomonadota bacterium]
MADAPGFYLQVSTLHELLFHGQVSYVGVPGVWGYLGVLKDHAPLLTELAPGRLVIRPLNAPELTIDVMGGIVEVAPWGVTLLADYAGHDARAEEARMAEARRQAAVHVPFAERPIGAAAVRAELDVELVRFFAAAMRDRR